MLPLFLAPVLFIYYNNIIAVKAETFKDFLYEYPYARACGRNYREVY